MADADAPRPPAATCPGCGRPRDAADLLWSSRHTADGVEYLCPECTRADLRLIEAGLPVS